MKIKATIALLIAASAGAHAATIHDGLLNYWALDGNGNDSASDFTGSTGVVEDDLVIEGSAGAATIASSGGLFGGAADFERDLGTDGRLAAADSVDVSAGGESITISLWTRFDNTGARWQSVLAKGESADYRVSTFNRTGNFGYAGGNGDINSGVSAIGTTDWQHVVVSTAEGGITQIFVNGTLASSSATGSSIVDDGNINDGELWIGNNSDVAGTTRMWDGQIDDVAQWDRVLTADEVTEIYTAGLEGISLGAIPEPSSGLLLGLGGLMVVLRRRR